MERKRKLPARAAARVESEAKRRHSTPREPSKEPTPEPVIEEPSPPPPLPRSVQAGQPLPTIENAQDDDLSLKEFQSIKESGVLTESLSRSRHKWIQEGLFEKYWTKPYKRKGVVNEDPKNPPKDSMTKVGTVTITIEPHIIEATMFAVKDPKSKEKQNTPQQKQANLQTRPIIQYGPPNGSMPPPRAPGSASASPAPESSTPKPLPEHSAHANTQKAPTAQPTTKATFTPKQTVAQPATSIHTPPPGRIIDGSRLGSTVLVDIPGPSTPGASTAGPSSSTAPRPPSNPPQGQSMAPAPGKVPAAPTGAVGKQPTPANSIATPTGSGKAPAALTGAAGQQPAPANSTATPSPGPGKAPMASTGAAGKQPAPPNSTATPSPGPGKPATAAPAAKTATNDPVIALLAQRASGDPELRDLMKRVAVGQAKQSELSHFQSIINQLNAEYKRGGGQQGPSADRLLVDGRTVRYFADEVCAILDIVLASNPNQRASELRPPPKSDGLVVLLVKTALEDKRTKDMCRRISTGKPGFTDATDLKEILDRLYRDSKTTPQTTPATSQARPAAPASNGQANGRAQTPGGQGGTQGGQAAHGTGHPNPQALRSKGPPPASKPDVSAVVFDFGTGDRYLFPKFSILEYLPTRTGQEVLASFLIVRKGSLSEYGGDPKLDYYQPVTMRLSTPTGRHLENLSRVVAPQDEVRRYMDDVMDNMTRGEYILLAMRLPRAPKEEGDDNGSGRGNDESKTGRSTPQAEKDMEPPEPAKPSVLWTTNAAPQKPADSSRAARAREAEEEADAQYRRLISSVAAREPR